MDPTETLLADPSGGTIALEWARRLGAWTGAPPVARRPLREGLATATDDELSEEHLYWVSELGRLTELAGGFAARVDAAAQRLRGLRAAARQTARTEAEVAGARAPSQAALDDVAECDPTVLAAEREAGVLRLAAAHVASAREATAAYVAGLSREITLRGDQRRARLL